MLTVTDAAKAELKRIVEARGLPPNRCLRLAVPPVWTGEGDFGVVVDDAGQQDLVIAHEGVGVLRIEEAVALGLEKSILDFKSPPDGPRFTLDVH